MKNLLYILLLSPLFFVSSCEEEVETNEPLYEIGDVAEGGIVFYYDNLNQRGLVVAENDIGSYQWWGCFVSPISPSIQGANLHSIGSGLQNTLDIIGQCNEENIAAQMCYNYVSDILIGYDDWFLPSINELEEIYKVFAPFPSTPSLRYWSSTYEGSYPVNNIPIALSINMTLVGYAESWGAQSDLLVRPIRRFGDWSSFEISGCTDENASNFQINAEVDDNTCCYNCYFTNSSEFYGNFCGDNINDVHNSFQEGSFQQYVNGIPQFNEVGQPVMINLSGIISCDP